MKIYLCNQITRNISEGIFFVFKSFSVKNERLNIFLECMKLFLSFLSKGLIDVTLRLRSSFNFSYQYTYENEAHQLNGYYITFDITRQIEWNGFSFVNKKRLYQKSTSSFYVNWPENSTSFSYELLPFQYILEWCLASVTIRKLSTIFRLKTFSSLFFPKEEKSIRDSSSLKSSAIFKRKGKEAEKRWTKGESWGFRTQM